MAIYHVSKQGSDRAAGTAEQPFLTINHAAAVAVAGDTVVVHSGEYREWVDPRNGGLSDTCRVTYEVAPGEHAVIKGSEEVTGWEKAEGTVWKKTLPNSLFGDWNPFAEAIEGDWLIRPEDYRLHTGDVYLNGTSLYEARTYQDVLKAERRETGYQHPLKSQEKILHPEQTVYQWYAEVGEETTILYANFQAYDPNRERVEINVRECCFYPRQVGINYITLRGFEICQAACPFTPPTADQPGMVGAHWSRGWIIENNDLHDAKCSAVSLGKEATTGHNLYARFGRKPGYQYQMEAVFLGLQAGWCKEKIGSHIVRDNVIHDCGQNAVVGHMGCAFSRIEHNHIYNIAVKHEFFGWEIGGIKLHAAIDVVIARNNIHHCTLGTWLDWEAQGTRVTRNLYHHNDRDIMVEVSHGPCLLDHNVFASAYFFDNMAQGTAMVHNLICGYIHRQSVLDRATPYHFAHSTQAAGCAVVYGGDDRLMNNIFAGERPCLDEGEHFGSAVYDGCTTPEEYPVQLAAEGNTDAGKFYKVPQPAYVCGNAYGSNIANFRAEKPAVRCAGVIDAEVECENGTYSLILNVPAELAQAACAPATTARLGMPRITEENYENTDGSPIDFGVDLLGAHRGDRVLPGPLALLAEGRNRVVLWKE